MGSLLSALQWGSCSTAWCCGRWSRTSNAGNRRSRSPRRLGEWPRSLTRRNLTTLELTVTSAFGLANPACRAAGRRVDFGSRTTHNKRLVAFAALTRTRRPAAGTPARPWRYLPRCAFVSCKVLRDCSRQHGSKSCGVADALRDLELCAELPDGVIRTDLLRRNSEHSTSGAVELRSVSHLWWWLRKRMRVLRIPRSELTVATVVMEFRTDRILTNRAKLVSFDWQART